MGEPGSLRQREGLGKVPECCSLWQPVLDERCPDHGRGLSRKAPASSVRTLVLICAPLLFPEALHPFHPQSRALCLSPPGPPSLCTVLQELSTSRDSPCFTHVCVCTSLCACGGVIWKTSISPLNLAAAREGEGLESHGRDPGPKVGETLMASIQPKRGSSTFIGAGREQAGVSHPGLERC